MKDRGSKTKKTSALKTKSACAVKKRSVFVLKRKSDYLRSRSDRGSSRKKQKKPGKRKLTMIILTCRGRENRRN